MHINFVVWIFSPQSELVKFWLVPPYSYVNSSESCTDCALYHGVICSCVFVGGFSLARVAPRLAFTTEPCFIFSNFSSSLCYSAAFYHLREHVNEVMHVFGCALQNTSF